MRSDALSAVISAAAAPTLISSAPAASLPIYTPRGRGRPMPILHVEKLRSGESTADEYTVVETIRGPRWGEDATFTVVGHPHPRVEGEDRVTGRARYAYDICLPGLLYARVLRSPLPHARIRRIDTSRATALPGVRGVLTSADAPEITWYQDSWLFDRIVRYIGDEVAAVAADAEEIAEDALRLI